MSEAAKVHERQQKKIQIFDVRELGDAEASLPVGIDFGKASLVIAQKRPEWFLLLRSGRAWLKPEQAGDRDIRTLAESAVSRGLSIEAESLPVEAGASGAVGAGVSKLVRAASDHAEQDGIQEIEQPSLSQRELEVLQLLSEGWSNQEIGRFANLSLGTVKFHLAHIFEKLGAANRAEAVRRAAESGLLQF